MSPHLVLFFLLLHTYANAQESFEIGRLSELAHDVSGTLVALDSRTLRIDNFVYDGTGPQTFFWVNRGSSAGRDGTPVPFQQSCDAPRLRTAYDSETILLELPPGYSIGEIGHFSVWCESASSSFGGVDIPRSIPGLPERPVGRCEEDQSTFPVPEGWNCETLSDDFQVRWNMNGENIDMELVGRVTSDQYMGFGPSGDTSRTDMDNSDPVIAFASSGSFDAVDFHVNSRENCVQGRGVCPDTMSSPSPGSNDITGVEGSRVMDSMRIKFTRPLAATDSPTDMAYNAVGDTYVVWAIGPVENGLPFFHGSRSSMNIPRGNVRFNFGRSPENRCNPLVAQEEEEPLPGFIRPTISNVTEITARIGPSGGRRGVQGITGGASWGIAWYLSETGSEGEDILIPALGVERGKNYTFKVYGGVNETAENIFHPFYITDSEVGGYAALTPSERARETVYAGIDVLGRDSSNGVTEFNATATGAECEFLLKSGNSAESDTIDTYEEFYETLNTSCTQNQTITDAPGELVWNVPADAPDVLYYQCVTHRFLGFKIGVFDEGEVDQTVLNNLSGGSRLENTDEACAVSFQGELRRFEGCRTDLSSGVEVYWTFRDEEFDTLFRAPTNGGYVGFAWGVDMMVGSNAVIAYGDGQGGAVIDDYFLAARNTAGVQPSGRQGLTNVAAEASGAFITGFFTRPRSGEGIPTIEIGPTDAIWAVGNMPSSPTTLVQHSERSLGTIDLSVRTGAVEESSGFGTIFTVHAVLMGIAWYVVVPIAITAMRFFRKYNPTTFYLHRAFNSIAVGIIVAAFIIGLVEGSHTETAHLVIGSIASGLAIIQFFGGWLRPSKEARSRKVWFILHSVAGAIALGLAQANGFIGVGILDAGFGWYIVLGIAVGIYVILQFVFGFMPKKFPTRMRECATGDESGDGSTADGDQAA